MQSAAADPPGDANSLPDLPLPASSNGTVGQDVPYPGQDIPYTGQQIAFDPTVTSAEPAEHGNPFGSSAATDAYGTGGSETSGPDDRFRVPPYQAQVSASQATAPPTQPPPYPAQVPPPPSAGMASKVTAPFAALTKPKTKTKPKKPPRSSRPAPPQPGPACGEGTRLRGHQDRERAQGDGPDAPRPARAGQDRALVGHEVQLHGLPCRLGRSCSSPSRRSTTF